MEKPNYVLHLEEDAADAELIQETLEFAGLACQITRVQTCDEFSRAVRQGGYDVILADFRLPMYDGMTALRLARDQCPDVPFIFISGVIGEDSAIDALTEGATDYVLKQKLPRLASAIQRALREGEYRQERKRAEELMSSDVYICRVSTHLGHFELVDWLCPVARVARLILRHDLLLVVYRVRRTLDFRYSRLTKRQHPVGEANLRNQVHPIAQQFCCLPLELDQAVRQSRVCQAVLIPARRCFWPSRFKGIAFGEI